jgi:hypothetical protein
LPTAKQELFIPQKKDAKRYQAAKLPSVLNATTSFANDSEKSTLNTRLDTE